MIAGAIAKTLLDEGSAGLLAEPAIVVVGVVTSFVSGIAAVAFLMSFMRAHSLAWFVPYRLALAAVLLIASATGQI